MNNNKSNDVAVNSTDTNSAHTNSQESTESKLLPFNYQESKLINFLAILAAFLFVLGLGYLVYKQFISTKVDLSNKIQPQITQEAANSVRQNKEKSANVFKNKKQNNEPKSSSSNTNEQNTVPRQGDVLTNSTQSPFSQHAQWRANNYTKGDIKQGNYTVKAGDTLWEIAEAVYGDGTQWVKILSANSSGIEFLPNGQQALIYAGQTLTIP
jgi:uncharacterized protein HemX